MDHQKDETLIVLTPHIIHMPYLTKANLQPLLSGTETTVQTQHENELRTPQQKPTPQAPPPTQPQQPLQMPQPTMNPTAPSAAAPSSQTPQTQPDGAIAK